VKNEAGELNKQFDIQSKVDSLEKVYPDRVAPYVNLSVASCLPKLQKKDISNARGKSCAIHPELQTEGVKNGFDNLITPKQGDDLYKTGKPASILIPALKPLCRAILLLNSVDVIHSDLHTGNVAWMGDKLVVHDWGRATTTRGDFINGTLAGVQGNMRHFKEYPQYVRPCELTDECGLGVYTHRLSVQQILAIPRLMRVWDTLGLLGYIYSDILKRHPQFNSISASATLQSISKIKELAKNSTIVKVDNVQAIMDEYFGIIASASVALAPTGVPRIATPKDDSMRGMPTSKDMSMDLSPSPAMGGARKKPRTQTRRFCKCIKSVKKTGKTERGAIAICVHSVLQSRGRTMKKFNCGRLARVFTQKAKRL
jgi:hypothetical protein